MRRNKGRPRSAWKVTGRRRFEAWVTACRLVCGLVSRMSPNLSSLLAERIFRTPLRGRYSSAEEAALARGAFSRIATPSGALAAWSWGQGPAVLLVHGWGGHGGRLWRYVDPLTEAGFRVVAFDAPGHGGSPGGPVSLPEIADAIRAVAQRVGPLSGLVAHSVGATASALAMRRGLRVDRAVFLAPPADLQSLCGRFARILKLPRHVREGMETALLRRYRAHWSQFRIVDWACALPTSLLVFHDRRDVKVPLADGQAIAAAWQGSILVETRGLGHHKILRAPSVVRSAVDFLTASGGRRGRGFERVAPVRSPEKSLLMSFSEYRRKRRFDVTPEPPGVERKPRARKRPLAYVVQKHRASRPHYDFRLEWNGVLVSWAVPKGPSLDPSVKRLATPTEDHPLEYRRFEGVIPEGEYGGGTVQIWDRGWWTPDDDDVDAALFEGELGFTIHGKKLKGAWTLVRTAKPPGDRHSRPSWLLIKRKDRWASTESDIALSKPRSVATGRLLAEIARDEGGDVAKAATADPPKSHSAQGQ